MQPESQKFHAERQEQEIQTFTDLLYNFKLIFAGAEAENRFGATVEGIQWKKWKEAVGSLENKFNKKYNGRQLKALIKLHDEVTADFDLVDRSKIGSSGDVAKQQIAPLEDKSAPSETIDTPSSPDLDKPSAAKSEEPTSVAKKSREKPKQAEVTAVDTVQEADEWMEKAVQKFGKNVDKTGYDLRKNDIDKKRIATFWRTVLEQNIPLKNKGKIKLLNDRVRKMVFSAEAKTKVSKPAAPDKEALPVDVVKSKTKVEKKSIPPVKVDSKHKVEKDKAPNEEENKLKELMSERASLKKEVDRQKKRTEIDEDLKKGYRKFFVRMDFLLQDYFASDKERLASLPKYHEYVRKELAAFEVEFALETKELEAKKPAHSSGHVEMRGGGVSEKHSDERGHDQPNHEHVQAVQGSHGHDKKAHDSDGHGGHGEKSHGEHGHGNHDAHESNLTTWGKVKKFFGWYKYLFTKGKDL